MKIKQKIITQAITTYYVPQTEKLPARMIAKAQAGKVTVPLSDCRSDYHRFALDAFVAKWGWDGHWAAGASHRRGEWVWVRLGREDISLARSI
jgi:hypothetical protein